MDRTGTPPDPLLQRFESFVLERHPFALAAVRHALTRTSIPGVQRTPDAIESVGRELRSQLGALAAELDVSALPEITPQTSAAERLAEAVAVLVDDVEGFFTREAVAASLTPDERREVLAAWF